MILLLGASGQLGTAFTDLLEDFETLSREELDLGSVTPQTARRALSKTTPDILINCAGYTNVDLAEKEPDLASRVNGESVGILASVTRELGIPLITFSTDYVFDGRGSRPYVESDQTEPVNEYGRSKLLGERLALQANPRTLVIRTSWLVSGTHPNFVGTILRRASARNQVKVVDDQTGCPTVAHDLARATLEAVGTGATGLLHMTNQGQATWYELARQAIAIAGLDVESIEPCATEEYPSLAPRPAYSVLASENRAEWRLAPLPDWRDSLPGPVEELVARI